jgi:hypothetical protein
MSLENVYKRLYLAKLNVPMDLIRKIADELECDHFNSLSYSSSDDQQWTRYHVRAPITCYKCRKSWPYDRKQQDYAGTLGEDPTYDPDIISQFEGQSDEVTAAANRELKSRKDAERAAETAKAEEAARLEKESKTPQQLIEDLEEKKKNNIKLYQRIPGIWFEGSEDHVRKKNAILQEQIDALKKQ